MESGGGEWRMSHQRMKHSSSKLDAPVLPLAGRAARQDAGGRRPDRQTGVAAPPAARPYFPLVRSLSDGSPA
jgi:hypothetical protein